MKKIFLIIFFVLFFIPVKSEIAVYNKLIIGIWKKAYDPKLKYVYEIDNGCLVFTPTNEFFDYLDNGTILYGVYNLKKNVVILNHKYVYRYSINKKLKKELHKKNYSWNKRQLIYSGKKKIVFFDDLKKIVEVDVLQFKDSLNYSFGKIF